MSDDRHGARTGQRESATNSHGINRDDPGRSYTLPQGFVVLTDEEWAGILDMEAQAFRDMIRKKGIPAVPVNRGILVSTEDYYHFGKAVYDPQTGEWRRLHLPVWEGVGSDSDGAVGGRKAEAPQPKGTKPRRGKGSPKRDAGGER